ncbi:YbaB/EbfC family nucleoid-associated protein [Amycolatopsis sp. TRM77291]
MAARTGAAQRRPACQGGTGEADLENNVVTLSSPDRLVTVTVNAGGGLTSLSLSPQA